MWWELSGCFFCCCWISLKPTNLWVTKTCHNVTCFFNWNIFKSLKALYLLFSLHRLKWTPFPILKYYNDCCKIWSKMLPPERLHSTMNQKSARTLLTCLNVSKQGRLSAGVGGWWWWWWLWWWSVPWSWPHPQPPTSNICEVQRSQLV